MTIRFNHQIAGVRLSCKGCKMLLPKGPDVVLVPEPPEAILNDVRGNYWHSAESLERRARDRQLDLRNALVGATPPQTGLEGSAAF